MRAPKRLLHTRQDGEISGEGRQELNGWTYCGQFRLGGELENLARDQPEARNMARAP